MTEQDALLAGIFHKPADDAPRLVYADWLTDNGEPERAEFIRVQCELAQYPESEEEFAKLSGVLRRKFHHLQQQEWEFLVCHENDWLGPVLSKVPGPSSPQSGLTSAFEWSRGFVASASLTTAAFVGYLHHPGPQQQWIDGVAAALFSCQPVEAVRLTDREPYWNGKGYCWYDLGRIQRMQTVPESAELPRDLFVYLGQPHRRLVDYPTAAAAHAALSAGCIVYGTGLREETF